ncbi:MAG: surface-adhesin E family protein [Burkholderiaceae bacterium]
MIKNCRWMGLLLLVLTASAHAEWSRVGYFANGNFYIDRATIASVNGHREVWSMMDYGSPQMDQNRKIYRSTRSMLQLDCPQKKARIIHMTFFSGSMLGGNEISKMGMLQDWSPVPPDTPIRGILDDVCRR